MPLEGVSERKIRAPSTLPIHNVHTRTAAYYDATIDGNTIKDVAW